MKTAKKPAPPLAPANGFQLIPLAQLASNPEQPRRQWDTAKDEEGKDSLERLAESIKAEGVLQPLVVTPRNGKFLIVCGERRFRAARILGLKELPCVVRPTLSDRDVLELSITENLQRLDLSPIDKARAIKTLMDQCKLSQRQIGARLGMSVAKVNYALSLLDLDKDLQQDVKAGRMSAREGREIVQAVRKVKEPEKRAKAMSRIKESLQRVRKSTTDKTVGAKKVASIAKVAVAEVDKPAAEPANNSKPIGQQVAAAKALREMLGAFERSLSAHAVAIASTEQRTRIAEALYETDKGIVERVRAIHAPLTRLLESLQEMRTREEARSAK
jgi:ParB family chromosome partitioning protein